MPNYDQGLRSPADERGALLVNVAATVDVKGGSGQVTRVLTGKERDDGGNLVGGGGAADRNVTGELGFLLVGGADADVGVDGARRDRVDRDPGVGDLPGQGLGESEDRGLRRRVRHLPE